ncbi:hypothetical protein F3Y22_tig00111917pilonHSYRG00095 [Hibiscus syriacus]|uniref:Protein kinase domain-containing protein n=1 Tax=Hibiscus syriacus TaxID=106335 RepID=A0A6A2X8T3_HIBSY|nr:receptor kinase-like protein Xa21 [Hibiscus syriacus]KAE8671811.1 hypothetical protein F3Y22_tig00111917pilonHSYRG00095 [Hibiscus syriacus]
MTLWRLSNLLELDLSSNFLRGSVPLDVGNLKVLISMDLSNNRNLPSTINGDLNSLIYLSFAENSLQGQIPDSFGHLTSLEFLDLSRNRLSGVIPKSMEALSHLKYLNFSFNRLECEIPTEGPFQNLSAESFGSNEALCGSPRLQVTPCKAGSDHRLNRAWVLMLKCILPAIISAMLLVTLIIILVRYRNSKRKVPIRETSLPLATWRRISYYELRVATDGFNESCLTGTGTFGSVYKGTLSDSATVAVKVFDLRINRAFRSLDSECEVMRSVRHRNLVKVISTCSKEIFKALVLEFMPNGSLEK